MPAAEFGVSFTEIGGFLDRLPEMRDGERQEGAKPGEVYPVLVEIRPRRTGGCRVEGGV